MKDYKIDELIIRGEIHLDGRWPKHLGRTMSWKKFSEFAISSINQIEDINLEYDYYCVVMQCGSIFIIQKLA